mgnify:FL=1
MTERVADLFDRVDSPAERAPDQNYLDPGLEFVVDLTVDVDRPVLSDAPSLLVAPKWKTTTKRIFDVIVAAVALIVLSPVFLATALAVKLSSPGPVFFVQPRMGRAGKEFSFYKFRSMRIDAEEQRDGLRGLNEMSGPVFKIKDDPRMTPIGVWLRRTSIDELPQLWHVIRGQMTLVGPRPLPTEEALDCSEWEAQRFLVKPGITCIWQVSGRSGRDFETWVSMDSEYIEN